MKTRHQHQQGYIFKKGGSWFLRYREDGSLPDGRVKRIQKCKRLAEASGRYRTKSAVEDLAEEFLRPINDGSSQVESTMSLNQFIESSYLPYVRGHRRESTYTGYRNIWQRYVRPDGAIPLRDVRTREAEKLLETIAEREDLCRTTLQHIKHFLSGVFRYALRQGILSGANPVRDVELPKSRPGGETHAYTLEQELAMLEILPEPARTIVACAAFTAVRKGELRAFAWENYDGEVVNVLQSVWRSRIGEPKREKSAGPVPVITQLQSCLNAYRRSRGNPKSGLMFRSPIGKPINLDALAREVIRPALAKAGIPWYGWHGFRRGLATNLHRLGVPVRVIQQILRHGNVSSTGVYIKQVEEDAVAAMKVFEEQIATVSASKRGDREPRNNGANGKCATIVQRPRLRWRSTDQRLRSRAVVSCSAGSGYEGTGGEGGIRTPGTAFDRTTV